MEAGNAFLPGSIERYNARFAKTPARPEDLHRPLNIMADRLKEILCKREQRYVGAQLTFSYERKRIMLEENDVLSLTNCQMMSRPMASAGKRSMQAL